MRLNSTELDHHNEGILSISESKAEIPQKDSLSEGLVLASPSRDEKVIQADLGEGALRFNGCIVGSETEDLFIKHGCLY